MTDFGPLGSPRGRFPAATAGTVPSPRGELVSIEATRGNERVVALRLIEDGAGGYTVECDVDPVDGHRVALWRAGPYSFQSERDARTFVDEATVALQYLGCEIRKQNA